MSEEVILQFMAQDDISSVVETIQTNVVSAMEQIQQSISTMSSGFDNATTSVNNIGDAQDAFAGAVKDSTSGINDNTKGVQDNTSGVKENTSAKQELTNETRNTTSSTNESAIAFENHTNIANMSAGSLMYLAGQMSTLGTQMEQSAQGLNNTKIHMDQLGKMAGVTEGEMTNMITTMSNETFSNDEAIMYTKNLVQMGVAADKYVEQATNIDRINDAFGLGAETTNSLVTELSVLGVDMNDVSSSFNALAYANENTKGGMENFYSFLRKYDAELNTLGYDTDQAALIISAATQKYGGGRAALTGLSNALKEAGSDTGALEQALDMKSGALQHASEETASYEGDLQSLADEEMEHKTILERVGAAVDDFRLKHASLITSAESVMGVFGQVGAFALHGNAIREMGTAFLNWNPANSVIASTINRLKMFRTEAQGASKAASTLTSSVTPASASMMASGVVPTTLPKGGAKAGKTVGDVGKNAAKVSKETTQVVKAGTSVAAVAPEAAAAEAGMTATSGALAGISSAFTTMIVPLLAIAAVIAVMIPVMALLVAEALIFLKGIQMLIKALNFDGIDLTSSIEGIKQIGTALWEIGRAMGAMAIASVITAFTLASTFLLQLINPVKIAGQMLVQAANELQVFNNVNIDKSVPDKIKSIADSLKLVSDAMKSLMSLSVDMAWGNLLGRVLGSVTDAIKNARKDIEEAGKQIAQIKNLPEIDKGVAEKLEKISSSIESISKAFDNLRKIRDNYNWDSAMGQIFKGVDIKSAIKGIQKDLEDASSAIQSITVTDIGEEAGNRLQRVSSAIESVAKAFDSLRKIRDNYNWDTGWLGGWFQDFDITEAIGKINEMLVDASNSLQSLGASGGLAKIDEGVTDKIKNVTDALDKVLGAVDTMKKFQGKGGGENGDDFSSITSTIDNAKESLIKVSASLKSLGGSQKGTGGLQEIGEGVSDKIKTINTTLKSLSDSINSLKGFPVVSGDEIPNRVDKAVTVIQNGARHLSRLSGTKKVDGNVSTVISSVGVAGGRLKTSINAFKSFPIVSGDEIPNRVDKAVTVVQNSARHLSRLSGTKKVEGSISTLISSVGVAGGRLKTSINALKTFPIVSGNEIPNRVQKAVTAIKNVSKQIKKLKSSDKVGNISSILSSINKAVNNLKKTLSTASGGFKTAGVEIGKGITDGISSGLNNLGTTVSGRVASGIGAAKPTASTYGKGLGGAAVSGFKESFKIADAVSGELSAAASAISAKTPELSSAMGQLADQMVQEFKSHSGIKSPGHIAKSVRAEMDYSIGFVKTTGQGVINSVGVLADKMVQNFNPNLQSALNNVTSKLRTRDFSKSRLDALKSINDNVYNNTNTQRPVSIVIGEGAVQLDARNLTEKESRQVMVNALSGLDVIDGIHVRGV